MGGKSYHIDSASALPMRKVKSYGAFNGDTMSKYVSFNNFASNKTLCGAPQRVFGLIESASDYVPMQYFERSSFNNVHDDAMAFIMDPPEKWNNLKDCIGFPCTAPSNFIMDFKYTTHKGTNTMRGREKDFQIVPDYEGVSESYDNCEFKE